MGRGYARSALTFALGGILCCLSFSVSAAQLICPAAENAAYSNQQCQRFAKLYQKRIHHIEYYCQQTANQAKCSKVLGQPYALYLTKSMHDALVLTQKMRRIEQRWSKHAWLVVMSQEWQAYDKSKDSVKLTRDRGDYQLAIKALEAIDHSLHTFGLQVGLMVAPILSKAVHAAQTAKLDAQGHLREVLQDCASNAQVSAQCYQLNLPTHAEALSSKIAALAPQIQDAVPQRKKVVQLLRQQKQQQHKLAEIVAVVGLLNERVELLAQGRPFLTAEQVAQGEALYQEITATCAMPGLQAHCNQVLGNYPKDLAAKLKQMTPAKTLTGKLDLSGNTYLSKLHKRLLRSNTKLRAVTTHNTLAVRQWQQASTQLTRMRDWAHAIQQVAHAKRLVAEAYHDGQDLQTTINETCSQPKLAAACAQAFGAQQIQVKAAYANLQQAHQSLQKIDQRIQSNWQGINAPAIAEQVQAQVELAQSQLGELATDGHLARNLQQGVIEIAGSVEARHAWDRRTVVEDYLDTVMQAEQELLQNIHTMANAVPLTSCRSMTNKQQAKICLSQQKITGFLKQSMALLPELTAQKHQLRQLRNQLTPSSCTNHCAKANQIALQAEAAKNLAQLKANIVARFTAAARQLQSLA